MPVPVCVPTFSRLVLVLLLVACSAGCDFSSEHEMFDVDAASPDGQILVKEHKIKYFCATYFLFNTPVSSQCEYIADAQQTGDHISYHSLKPDIPARLGLTPQLPWWYRNGKWVILSLIPLILAGNVAVWITQAVRRRRRLDKLPFQTSKVIDSQLRSPVTISSRVTTKTAGTLEINDIAIPLGRDSRKDSKIVTAWCPHRLQCPTCAFEYVTYVPGREELETASSLNQATTESMALKAFEFSRTPVASCPRCTPAKKRPSLLKACLTCGHFVENAAPLGDFEADCPICRKKLVYADEVHIV